MDPWALAAGIAGIASVLAIFLGGLVWARSGAVDAGAALLEEREARHVAERALAARLLAEQHGHVEALAAQVDALHARSVAAGTGGHADLVALARLAAAPGAGGDPGLLSAFAPAASGGAPRPGAAPAAPAGGPVGAAVAGDGRVLAAGGAGARG